MLKKIFFGVLIVLVLVLVFHSFIIGTFVKPQVEQQASKILGTDVQISVLSVRLWPGSAAVYGLKIKNPSGFSDENLLDLGSASVALDAAGLIKEFSSGAAGSKSVVIDHVKIKGLKLLVERMAQANGPISNLEKLVQNLNAQAKPADKPSEASTTPEKTTPEQPTQKPLDLKVELKEFSFTDGKVTVRDSTIGSRFDYAVNKININVKNIYFPAKPASELVETIDASAQLGNQNAGSVSFQGRSNLMAGVNIDSKLLVKGVALSDFNAFLADQPFQISAGQFDLESAIKVTDNQLASQHQLKLTSMELKNKAEGNGLIGLPIQTLIATLSRLPSLDVPFEVNGDLKNPQFKVTKAISAAITAAIQKVLAGGLGDLTGAAKELTGVANSLAGQALGVAGASTGEISGDAKKLIQGITGEGSESVDKGLKKLSGFLSKVKSE